MISPAGVPAERVGEGRQDAIAGATTEGCDQAIEAAKLDHDDRGRATVPLDPRGLAGDDAVPFAGDEQARQGIGPGRRVPTILRRIRARRLLARRQRTGRVETGPRSIETESTTPIERSCDGDADEDDVRDDEDDQQDGEVLIHVTQRTLMTGSAALARGLYGDGRASGPISRPADDHFLVLPGTGECGPARFGRDR